MHFFFPTSPLPQVIPSQERFLPLLLLLFLSTAGTFMLLERCETPAAWAWHPSVQR